MVLPTIQHLTVPKVQQVAYLQATPGVVHAFVESSEKWAAATYRNLYDGDKSASVRAARARDTDSVPVSEGEERIWLRGAGAREETPHWHGGQSARGRRREAEGADHRMA